MADKKIIIYLFALTAAAVILFSYLNNTYSKIKYIDTQQVFEGSTTSPRVESINNSEVAMISEQKKVDTSSNIITPEIPSSAELQPQDNSAASDSSIINNDGTVNNQAEEVKSSPPLLMEKLNYTGDAIQTIIVTTGSLSSISATLETFELVDGVWKRVFEPIPAVIGLRGFSSEKSEGDRKAPAGIFSLGTCFGKYANPGTKMHYRQTTENDFWVDDSTSPFYNTWQTGPANGRWTSAESLRLSSNLYDYALVINYNTSERIPGKGSAIFMHIWRGPGSGTEGCTAMSQDNLLRILRWLDPSKKPVIIQGPLEWITKL